MPKAGRVRFTVVRDLELGHVTIDVTTPFRWISKTCLDDSLRVKITEDTVSDLLESIAANLELCPRAKLLVEELDGDSRVEWVEFFDRGLEVFIDTTSSDAVEEVCDRLWLIIQDVAMATKYVAQMIRDDRFGLFPRSLNTTLSGAI